MRVVSRGDTTVVDVYLDADPAPRRLLGGGGVRRRHDRQADVHAVLRRLLPDARRFQGKVYPVGAGGRGGRRGAHQPDRRAGPDPRLRHGRHRRDASAISPATTSGLDRDRRGADHRADDEHPHRRRPAAAACSTYDGARMRVGPASAGANPGPACYGRGGPLAVTDANAATGRLRPEFFPAIFGPDGDRPLDFGRDGGEVRGAGRRDRQAGGGGRRGLPGASRSRTWPTRSRRSACSAATTSPTTA